MDAHCSTDQQGTNQSYPDRQQEYWKRFDASTQDDAQIQAGAEEDDAALQTQFTHITDAQNANVKRTAQRIGNDDANGNRNHRRTDNRREVRSRNGGNRDRDAQGKSGYQPDPGSDAIRGADETAKSCCIAINRPLPLPAASGAKPNRSYPGFRTPAGMRVLASRRPLG